MTTNRVSDQGLIEINSKRCYALDDENIQCACWESGKSVGVFWSDHELYYDGEVFRLKCRIRVDFGNWTKSVLTRRSLMCTASASLSRRKIAVRPCPWPVATINTSQSLASSDNRRKSILLFVNRRILRPERRRQHRPIAASGPVLPKSSQASVAR